MSRDHRMKLAGAVVLLCAMLVVGPHQMILHAQEDEWSTAPPAAEDDAAGDSAANAADTAADAGDPSDASSADSVLELPQVVAVNHDAAASAATDPNAADPNAPADPSADLSDPVPADEPAADQPNGPTTDRSNDLAAYATEGAGANEAPPVSAPLILPGAAIVSASPLSRYALVGPVRAPVPMMPVVPAPNPFMSTGPIMRTSPMLMAPLGSHVIMGGWWHRAR